MAGIGDAIGAFAGGLAGGLDSGDQGKGSNLSRFVRSKLSGKKTDVKTANDENPPTAFIPERAKGGRIKKTGIYRLHKGEMVVPSKIVSAMGKESKGTRKKARKTPRPSGRR